MVSAGISTMAVARPLTSESIESIPEFVNDIPEKSVIDILENKYLQISINSDALY